MIDNFKEWLAHMGVIREQDITYSFWDYLNADMTGGGSDRSPWGMMETARFAKSIYEYYDDWSIEEIYRLICDEDRHNKIHQQYGNEHEEFFKTTTDYSIEFEGKSHLITNVPVRISLQTGKKYYSPETLEQIQNKVWAGVRRSRFDE